MSIAKLLAASSSEEKLYVDDVFSTYLYTGNGATQTITNGIDISGKGGLVWLKQRNGTGWHWLFDTQRGVNLGLATNSSAQQSNASGQPGIYQFNSNGFDQGSHSEMNGSGSSMTSWTFRRAPKFFETLTFTHTNGTTKTIDLSYLGTVGFVTIKRTDAAGDWYAWHCSLTAGNNLKLNTTDAQSTTNAYISVTGTTLTFSASAPSGIYVLYGWAHDESKDGLIQCGVLIGGATNIVNLGFEPQFIITRPANVASDWYVFDTMRGWTAKNGAGGNFQQLFANTSGSETASASFYVTPTGFAFDSSLSGSNYIYIAIRRPNKPPKTGAEVYLPSTSSGVINAGFPVDLHLGATRAGASTNHGAHSRLVGGTKELATSSAAAEATVSDLLFDSNFGLRVSFPAGQVHHFFRRAPGFMDVVCDTGTFVAHTVPHNLAAKPELIIRKRRDNAVSGAWYVYCDKLNDPNKQHLVLNLANGAAIVAGLWGSGVTENAFGLGATFDVNVATAAYVSYMFATLPGVSKVGRYTGGTVSKNKIAHSEAFDNAAWGKINASVSANVIAAPDGTMTGGKLVENTAATTGHFALQAFTNAGATTYTFSCHFKAGERDHVALWVRNGDGSGNYASANFNLTTGVAVANAPVGAGYSDIAVAIVDVGGGWLRASMTCTVDASITSLGAWIRLMNNSGDVNYTGDGVSGLYVWGAQLETGSAATSYEKTAPGFKQINCGFTTGARFVMIKRIDAAGDWLVWDSARGIVAANDPHLSLNSTAVEVATDDSIDPDVLGFAVNQVAETNINVSGAEYIYLAIA